MDNKVYGALQRSTFLSTPGRGPSDASPTRPVPLWAKTTMALNTELETYKTRLVEWTGT